jgi:aminoglycoside phosphotransferase family enzyme
VHYPFLDFSTVAAREHDAREELRLNRRLAPRVYLGLMALQWDGERFALVPDEHLPAPGRTVDWLVMMQRLPAGRMLDRLLLAGQATPADIDSLADVLIPFYRNAPRATPTEEEHAGQGQRFNPAQGSRRGWASNLPPRSLARAAICSRC